MYWIVQENICQEAKWREMIEALERHSILYSVHKVVPFSGELIPDPTIPEGEMVWCMGSLSMGNVCKERGWKPGVVEVPPMTELLESPWRKHMLNIDAEVRTISELTRIPYAYHPSLEHFVRPVDDSKFIAGQIMTTIEIVEWAQDVAAISCSYGATVGLDTKVMISRPKKIQCEARFWIVNSRIVTYSLYKLGKTIIHDRALVDKDLIWFVAGLVSPMNCDRYEPAPAYCLDVCRDEFDIPKIIEINNINSSGFYDCDVHALVPELNWVRKR